MKNYLLEFPHTDLQLEEILQKIDVLQDINFNNGYAIQWTIRNADFEMMKLFITKGANVLTRTRSIRGNQGQNNTGSLLELAECYVINYTNFPKNRMEIFNYLSEWFKNWNRKQKIKELK